MSGDQSDQVDRDDRGDPALDRADRMGGVGPFLGGIASGMVLLGIIWVIMGGTSSGTNGAGQAGESVGAPTGQRSASAGTVDDAGELGSSTAPPTALDRCATASRSLEVPLDRAKAAIGQWAVHVGAMNKLVVGALTLSQAQAFWNQTRVAAYRRIDAFHAAERTLREDGIDCPTPRMLGTAASPELRACSQHVAAEADQLDAADTAITTWRHHVTAMDMLRMGKLSPTRATEMWLAMWQRGRNQIDRYAAAARTTRDTPGCDGTAAAPATDAGSPADGGSGNGPGASTDSPMPSMSSMN